MVDPPAVDKLLSVRGRELWASVTGQLIRDAEGHKCLF